MIKKKSFKMMSDTVPEFYPHEIKFPKYKKGDTVVLFDGDILAFKVASVCEFKYKFTNRDTGEEHLHKSIKDFMQYLEDEKSEISAKILKLAEDCRGIHPDDIPPTHKAKVAKLRKKLSLCADFEDFDREDVQVAEPVEYCIKTLKDAHNRVMRRLKATHYESYIGGGENFRLNLPLKEQYKLSVRGDSVRPLHLTRSKNFLVTNMKAIKVKGIEADDVMQMRAYILSMQGVKVYMYSNDKDRLQGYYGNYYNPDDDSILTLKNYLGEITEKKKGCGLKWLMFQVSQGDKIDGYSPKEFYSKDFYKRGYGQGTFYKDFSDTKTPKEFLEKFIEVHRDKLLTNELYEWEAFDGRKVKSNWLGIIELMFSCAYMKLDVEDKTTFSSLCADNGVDAGELIFEVRHKLDIDDNEMGCIDEKYKEVPND